MRFLLLIPLLLAAAVQFVYCHPAISPSGDSFAFIRRFLESPGTDGALIDLAQQQSTDGAPARSLLQYGSSDVPFTMSQVTSFNINAPDTAVNLPGSLWPWSSTGLIEHTDGPRSGTTCPAALIAPNLAVTSASCFCAYGGSNEFSVAKFRSAVFDGAMYFEAQVSNAFPSAPYCGGTDTCTTSGSLRKCANNIAVVSLLNINSPAGFAGLAPGTVSPYYNIEECPYSFTPGLTGSNAAQITALGYASNLNGGTRMMRTDSLGQLQSPNQLYIGSTMRANSRGSPMLVNFGLDMTNSNPVGSDAEPNTVVGVVSWYSAEAGGNDFLVGGSCFARNAQYTEYSNVITLVNTYCCTLNQEQRASQCAGVQTCFDDPVPPPPPPPPPVTASDWELSEANESCDSACQRAGLACNVSGQRAVTTLSQAIIVAREYLGVANPENLPTFDGAYADGPTIWAGSLQYNGSASTCSDSYDQSTRFCCCGSNCPNTVPGPTPPGPPPAPTPPTPPTPPPPGAPGTPTSVIQSGNTANGVVITWQDGTAGSPTESYKVECKMYQGTYSSTTEVSVTGIPRGTQSATVPINPSTLYTCYVVAYDPAVSPAYSDQVSSGLTASYQNSGTCTGRDLLDPTEFGAPRRCDTAPSTEKQREDSIQKQIAAFGKPVSELTGDEITSYATFAATVPICWYICQQTSTVTDTMLANQLSVLNNDYAFAGISFTQQSKTICSGQQQTNWYNNLGANSDINAGFNYLAGLSQTLGHNNCITVYMGDWEGTGLLGIAQLGLSTYPTQFNFPGTLPGGTLSPYNLGRTMTHETGHNLNLDHVFDQGCSGQGDNIADTPLGNTNYGCPVGQDSCTNGPGKDAINNFMDYTNDCCMNFFSPQQGLVMQAELLASKPGWVTSS